MAATYQSTSPNINRRVPIDSVIVITFSANLDQSTVNEGNILFTDALLVPIPFSVTGVTNTISITPDSDLTYDSVYIITLTNQITDTVPDPIDETEIKFITLELSTTPIISLTTDGNVNDLLLKRNLLMDLFDGREIIETGNKFNFEMVPQNYDETLKVYSNATTTKITFDNQTLFLDKIRKQELSTFDEFIDSIIELSGLTAAQVAEIEKTLLTKSFDINSSSGLIRKINYLIEIFANAFSLFFVDTEADPFDPLVYHISTTLPKIHWSSTLRKMIHPVGWLDNYIEIDQTETFQPDATAGTYWNYFQTEQYEWTDSYILSDDDFSLEFKGIRQGFGLHGQGVALYLPVTDSSGTPPSLYIPAALSGDQNLEANYANNIHVNRATGNVTGATAILTTDVDLTAFSVDEWGVLSGQSASDFYVAIAEGLSIGFYEIVTNTANSSGNTITINGTFPNSEIGLTFWVVDKEGTTQRELLSVLNALRTESHFVFSYLQGSQLGAVDVDSRLVFDASNNLQLIVVPGSQITSFTDAPSDTTFLYGDEDAPVLFVESSGGFQDQDEMALGNTVLQNIVISRPLIESGRFYEIASVSAADANDIQTITFVDAIDTSIAGDPGLEAGHTLTIVGMANTAENDGTFIIMAHDYVAQTVTILNEDAISEPAPSGSPLGEQKILAHNLVVTYILDSNFSDDQQYFNGLAIFFGECVIDPCDFNAMDEFKFQYAEWDAPINYPKVGGSDSDYLAFVADLNNEGDAFRQSNFDTMSSTGIFKKYYPTDLNVEWALGNRVYEITRIDASTDLATDTLGTWFGTMERVELSYPAWQANKSYIKGDRVIGLSGGNENYIFEADISDISGPSEPSWDQDFGSTTSPSGTLLTWTTIDQLNVVVRFMNTLVDEVWLEDSGTFTDYTKEANDQTRNSNLSGETFYTDDVPLLPGSPGATTGDAIYIGNASPFSSFVIDISTEGEGTYTITWQYSSSISGTGWAPLNIDSAGDDINDYQPGATGKHELRYTTPTDWVTDSIDASGSGTLYWVRGELTAITNLDIQPLAKQIFINTDFNTGPDTFYSNNETENELLTIESPTPIVDNFADFGIPISTMDRKVTLQHSIPDCDEYIWLPTVATGSDGKPEYVKNIPDIMSNKYILLGKESATYDVNLTINLFEREVTEITTLGDGSGAELDGTFFTMTSGVGLDYYVWFDENLAGNDPALLSGAGLETFTAIKVDFDPLDNADAIAIKMAETIETASGSVFLAAVDGTITDLVIVENIILGEATNITDGTLSGLGTGFDFNTTFEGRSNSEDIFDYLGL